MMAGIKVAGSLGLPARGNATCVAAAAVASSFYPRSRSVVNPLAARAPG